MFHKLCCRSKNFVQFSNGESIVIAYVGIVQLTTTLTLHNFLYKPSFSFNLIFVSQLTNSLKFSLIFMSILCLICFHWRDAIAAKIMGLEDNHCRTLTSLSSSKHPIGCKWVYKIKYKANGFIEVQGKVGSKKLYTAKITHKLFILCYEPGDF